MTETLKEYEVEFRAGFFNKKSFYMKAESAQALQEQIEEKMAFELSEGATYKIKPL